MYISDSLTYIAFHPFFHFTGHLLLRVMSTGNAVTFLIQLETRKLIFIHIYMSLGLDSKTTTGLTDMLEYILCPCTLCIKRNLKTRHET